MGSLSAGEWLSTLVSLDAVLVLSGAVLTSYIGVSGLLERMTLDSNSTPIFLAKKQERQFIPNHCHVLYPFCFCSADYQW